MATLKNTIVSDTSNLTIAKGTTAERPLTPANGMMRVNTTLGKMETYVGGTTPAWDAPTGIVTTGIVLHLDATNYPGTGTTWTDTSTNAIVMNATGTTQTPYVTLNGVKCFKMNGSGYWESSTVDGQKFNMSHSTLEFWYYYQGVSPRRTIFEKAGNSYASYQQELACTIEYGFPGNMSFYRKGGQSGTYDYANTDTFVMNRWNHMCVMLEPGANGKGYSILNMGPRANSYGLRDAQNTILAAGAVRVGNGYAGIVDMGYIAEVRVYNRVLSDQEVYQNFEAKRNKFGV